LQRAHALKIVGDVAASAARHGEFVQRMYARLQYRYIGFGAGFLDVDGAENSRRATAYYRYFGRLVQFVLFFVENVEYNSLKIINNLFNFCYLPTKLRKKFVSPKKTSYFC
jgi:hypothetical protein